ncbi:TRAP transporter fused permease subunit [Ruania alkalisoli]|uniref:TRAP transporter fused permease subunit n=1 Tax=Ruania alkalisoli TaxID=2779775 RepID=A0A7M1SPG0_9MICO|nr:TRAP transporter fused permease subunit [Ruania alkalisoli]QOR69365.1 TRAP transporter fused permease subunit [Ruania alkalisoli]
MVTDGYRQFLRPVAVLAIAWSVFQLYAAAAGAPHAMVFRPVHVAFGMALVFAIHPFRRSYRRRVSDHSDEGETPSGRRAPGWATASDIVLTLASLAIGAYYVLNSQRISERVTFIDEVTAGDQIVAIALLVVVLEACRRVVGPSLSIVALIFLAYQLWGDQLAGVLRHRGLDFERFVDLQMLSPQGLFGVPVGVSADYVFYFILFAAFLEVSGGGKLFIDLALAVTGRARGGPAKAAMLGSALMGSINGSAVANVVGTGVFTIPLMKRTGYKAKFAAAVEALASTGGQVLPPVMGAGAFIMAQMLGWDYRAVALAALIPAVLYFVAGYFMVHKEAQREDLRPIGADERTPMAEVVRRIHLLLPLILLVALILSGRSLMSSAFLAIAAVVVINFLRRATWFTPAAILKALQIGAQRAVNVALPTAVAGIIVGVIVQTNLGLRFTELVLLLSGGYLVLALIITMIGSIVLGLGMPTTSAYIMAAVLLTPPLIELGLPPIAAHLFVFYFACMSMITPPVALAAFAAAGIAGSPLHQTGLTAFRISLAAYLIPFAFALSPALLLQDGPWRAVWFATTAALGVYALAAAVIGYQSRILSGWQRAVFFVLAIALIYPGEIVSAIAAAGLVVAVVLTRASATRNPGDAVEPELSTTPDQQNAFEQVSNGKEN